MFLQGWKRKPLEKTMFLQGEKPKALEKNNVFARAEAKGIGENNVSGFILVFRGRADDLQPIVLKSCFFSRPANVFCF